MQRDDDVLVLVAHGTRSARGVEMVAALADAVGTGVGRTRVAFVDVLGPSPSEVLRDTPGRAILVPAFLRPATTFTPMFDAKWRSVSTRL